ncbi:MAG TPA: hypothetical protein VL098_04135 [Flavipsychrobacter sp.]|nr:hypothetical protein [Flavipsychrobacter sp.]
MVLALKREFTFMTVAMSGIFMPCKLVDEFFGGTSEKDEHRKKRRKNAMYETLFQKMIIAPKLRVKFA